MNLPCIDRDVCGTCRKKTIYKDQLSEAHKHDPDNDLMSPAIPEEGTKAAGALWVGTDTAAITSIINHHVSKGWVSGDRTGGTNKDGVCCDRNSRGVEAVPHSTPRGRGAEQTGRVRMHSNISLPRSQTSSLHLDAAWCDQLMERKIESDYFHLSLGN